MSLTVHFKYLEGLHGKNTRVLKVKFRGDTQVTTPVRGNDIIYLGQKLVWPVGRCIDANDFLRIDVYNQAKLIPDKFVGTLTIGLQGLVTKPFLEIKENLTNSHYANIRELLNLELDYLNPDGTQEEMNKNDFDYCVYKLDPLAEGEEFELPSEVGETRIKIPLISEPSEDETILLSEFVESDITCEVHKNIKKQNLPDYLQPTVTPCEPFQLRVTIYEGSDFVGYNLNPTVELQIAEEKKRTLVKNSTQKPYYSEQFVFNFFMPRAKFFSYSLTIRVLNMSNYVIARAILPGKLLGEFNIDIQNIYDQPMHGFFSKWVMLLDPQDPLSKAKGYIKVNMVVLAQGDKGKRPLEKSELGGDENIEKNILMPKSISKTDRQLALIRIKIYRADDLPKMNTSAISTLKHAILGKFRDLTDPFVEVSFSGYSGKTSVKRFTYFPEWNEEIEFTQLFPPYCNRIRISVYEFNAVKDELIATYFVDLNEIMLNEKNGVLPTFGPSWVNLYGNPRHYSYDDAFLPDSTLNESMGEGVAYRGRLLMAIKTEIPTDTGYAIGVTRKATPLISDKFAGPRETLLLFGAIFEANVISEELGKRGKKIHFEMSIGTIGNTLEQESGHTQIDDPMLPWIHSATEPMEPRSHDGQFYYLPINGDVPCVYLPYAIEDNRQRICVTNVLEKLVGSMKVELDSVRHKFDKGKPDSAVKRLIRAVVTGAMDITSSLEAIMANKGKAIKTKLDVERSKWVKARLRQIRKKFKEISREVNVNNLDHEMRKTERMIDQLVILKNDPQHALPNVFIWLIVNKKRYAFARILSRDIFYAHTDIASGKNCSKLSTIYLRKPGKKGVGEEGWPIQCQLKMFMWLGPMRDMGRFKENLPVGFDKASISTHLPPKIIYYTAKSTFQVRIYVYMARNVIGSDLSGLSDPFLRFMIQDHVVMVRIIPQTLNPVWDETVILENVEFPITAQEVKRNPPAVVAEIFDSDDNAADEDFIGRCFCQSVVYLDEENYTPAKLTFYKLYRGQIMAGELMVAIDFLEVSPVNGEILPYFVHTIEDLNNQSAYWDTLLKKEAKITARTEESLRVPDDIRPAMTTFRVEALLWGMRDLGRMFLLKVNRPKLIAEMGGRRIHSVSLDDYSIYNNFFNTLGYMDTYLPEDRSLWPPIFLQCSEKRMFGVEILVGNYVCEDARLFYIDYKIEDDLSIDTASFIYVEDEPEYEEVEEQLALEHAIDIPDGNEHQSQTEKVSVRSGAIVKKLSIAVSKKSGKSGKSGSQNLATGASGADSTCGAPSHVCVKKLSNSAKIKPAIDPHDFVSDRRSSVMDEINMNKSKFLEFFDMSIKKTLVAEELPTIEDEDEIDSLTGERKVDINALKDKSEIEKLDYPEDDNMYYDNIDGKDEKKSFHSSKHSTHKPKSIISKSSSGAGSKYSIGKKSDIKSKSSKSSNGSVIASLPGNKAKSLPGNRNSSLKGFETQSLPPIHTVQKKTKKGSGPGSRVSNGTFRSDLQRVLEEGQENDGFEGDFPIDGVVPGNGEEGDQMGLPDVIQNGNGPGSQQISQLQSKALRIKTRVFPTLEQMESADWWTRFYCTVDSQYDEMHPTNSDENAKELVDSDADTSCASSLEFSENSEVDNEPEEAFLDIPDDEADEKKAKKKRKNRLKKLKKLKKPKKLTIKRMKRLLEKANLRKTAEKLFKSEPIDFIKDYRDDRGLIKQEWISKTKIFNKPLEEVRGVEKFEESFRTFPLYKGIQVENELPTDRFTGNVKGNFIIYPIETDEFNMDIPLEELKLYKHVPLSQVFDVVVRVYVIRACRINPTDMSGLADPYLVVDLGGSCVERYVDQVKPRCLDPVFGIMTEFDVYFPQNSVLYVQIWDNKTVGRDEIIGQTRIDLENRFLSRHRGTVGLSEYYDTDGYAKWRDHFCPTEILQGLCARYKIDEPFYEPIFNKVTFAGRIIYADANIRVTGQNAPVKSMEPLALEILRQWHTFPFGWYLVPEHIESRPIYRDDSPGIVQGIIQMWVDVYHKDLRPVPVPISIAPRVPIGYELRVLVHNTEDVFLKDTSLLFNEKSSDIMVKGWMVDSSVDCQETDTHFGSRDGTGMFNWRLVYPFKYLKAEDCTLYWDKVMPIDIQEKENRVPCKFFCQVYDVDIIGANNYIGAFNFRLSKIPRCAKSSKACGLFQWDNPDVPTFSLFRNKKVRGWWPFIGEDDDTKERVCSGKVELEIELLTELEALQNPVGMGRDPPQPLTEPSRPSSNLMAFLSPLASMQYLCNKFKWILLKLLIVILLLMLIGYFIYNIPNYLAMKMVGP